MAQKTFEETILLFSTLLGVRNEECLVIRFDEYPLREVLPILLRGLKIKTLPKPRALKSEADKLLRTRANAEVFTPSSVVKSMVDALDDGHIDSRWLEIACGEAPFITNRYDAESGELVPLENRAGILDRKLRATADVKRAVQSVYGYELQSDSLLIARANVLLTAIESVKEISENDLAELAEIIVWNFFQLDGTQDSGMFAAQVIDWQVGRKFTFGGNTIKKFDFVIGNPPYQDDNGATISRKAPVYDKLMDMAHKVGKKVGLITPARFLFEAGGTSKDFNQRMLNDSHLKVLEYQPNARKVFKNVDIEGGVVITLRDEDKDFGAIGTFIPYDELKRIHRKVCADNPDFHSLREIIYTPTLYKLSPMFFSECPKLVCKLQKPDNNALRSNIFERLSECFFNEKPSDGHEYIQICGRQNNKRIRKWFRRDWVTAPAPLDKFKVLVPKANGASGKLSENEAVRIISKPIISEPFVGNTETFITIGKFNTREEAKACLAYVESKLCRVMLGILKVTQDNTATAWAKVPLQDFTSASDIDWSGDIDAQLYRKYGLDATEIEFIETHVKEMTSEK